MIVSQSLTRQKHVNPTSYRRGQPSRLLGRPQMNMVSALLKSANQALHRKVPRLLPAEQCLPHGESDSCRSALGSSCVRMNRKSKGRDSILGRPGVSPVLKPRLAHLLCTASSYLLARLPFFVLKLGCSLMLQELCETRVLGCLAR